MQNFIIIIISCYCCPLILPAWRGECRVRSFIPARRQDVSQGGGRKGRKANKSSSFHQCLPSPFQQCCPFVVADQKSVPRMGPKTFFTTPDCRFDLRMSVANEKGAGREGGSFIVSISLNVGQDDPERRCFFAAVKSGDMDKKSGPCWPQILFFFFCYCCAHFSP